MRGEFLVPSENRTVTRLRYISLADQSLYGGVAREVNAWNLSRPLELLGVNRGSQLLFEADTALEADSGEKLCGLVSECDGV